MDLAHIRRFLAEISESYVAWLKTRVRKLVCCRIAADILGSFLLAIAQPSIEIELVGGDTIFNNFVKPTAVHAWLIVGEYVVDPTVGQYTIDTALFGGEIEGLKYPQDDQILVFHFETEENVYRYRRVERLDFDHSYVEVAREIIQEQSDLSLLDTFRLYLDRAWPK